MPDGGHRDTEIMIPLVTSDVELAWVKDEIADEIARDPLNIEDKA